MSWENKTLTTVAQVESAVGRPAAMIALKQIAALDQGCRDILARSPIAAFGYRDASGTSRTTYIGGAAGFARVHSAKRFSIPGAPEAYGPVSLFFLLPGVGEVLRVNGTARGGSVEVAEAYIHCAQAVLRSRLWQDPSPPGPVLVAGDGPLRGPGVAEFLAASPFLALSTWDSHGGSDTSPRGDRLTVARILDGHTLAIPDRRGNKRADTLHNLLQDDRISLAALVPGRSGVLHVHGRATITDDPSLLATMALRGQAPHAALVIRVAEAFVSGNEAVIKSRLWSGSVSDAPDLMAIGAAHLAANSGRTGRLMRMIGAIPGLTRLMRRVIDRAYDSGLRKEGYDSMAVRVVALRRETPNAVTLVLDGSYDFLPGQFFTLSADIEGRTVRRAYSASSAPGPGRLEVTVKHVPGGVFSTYVHSSLKAGDRLGVRGPSGSFHASPSPLTVMIAAGSGITPMMSMIRARTDGKFALLYASRTLSETIFARELADCPDWLTVTHVLSSVSPRLDASRVRSWVSDLSPMPDTQFYVCGPAPLMEAARDALSELEVPASRVHWENFTSGPVTTTTPQVMTVTGHGSATVEAGQTLLDAGLAAGFPMPHSCTVGNCGDCLVRLRTGTVTASTPNCLTPQQQADGYALACVSCPLSPVTIDLTDPE